MTISHDTRQLAKAIAGAPTNQVAKRPAPLQLTRGVVAGVGVVVGGVKVTVVQLPGSTAQVPAEVSVGYGAKVGDVVDILVAPPRLIILGNTEINPQPSASLIGQTTKTTTLLGYGVAGLHQPGASVPDTTYQDSILINAGGGDLKPTPGSSSGQNVILNTNPVASSIQAIPIAQFLQNVMIGQPQLENPASATAPTSLCNLIGNTLVGFVPFIDVSGAANQIDYNVLIGDDPFISVFGNSHTPSDQPANCTVDDNVIMGETCFIDVFLHVNTANVSNNFIVGVDPLIDIGSATIATNNISCQNNIILGFDPLIDVGPGAYLTTSDNVLLGNDPFIAIVGTGTSGGACDIRYNTLVGQDPFIALGNTHTDNVQGVQVLNNTLIGNAPQINFPTALITNYSLLTIEQNVIMGEGQIETPHAGAPGSIANGTISNNTLIGGDASASSPVIGPTIEILGASYDFERCVLIGADVYIGGANASLLDTILLGGLMGTMIGSDFNHPFAGWVGGAGPMLGIRQATTAPGNPPAGTFFIYVDPTSGDLMAKGHTTTTTLAVP